MSLEIITGQKSQYKVQALLEYGYDDNIYEGQDLISKLDVAIQIQEIKELEEKKEERKILEAIMAQGESLKNVIQIFDVFELEDKGQRTLYTVMELCQQDFRCFWRDYKCYCDEIQKVQLASQVIRGVKELHQLGITHNCIHRENILCFSQESGDYILKCKDFKKAKQVNSNETMNNQGNAIVDQYFFDDIWSTSKILWQIFSATPSRILEGTHNQLLDQNWIKEIIRLLKVIRRIKNILQSMNLDEPKERSDFVMISKSFKEISSIICNENEQQTSLQKGQQQTKNSSLFTKCLNYVKCLSQRSLNQQQNFDDVIRCYDEGIKQNPNEFRIYQLKAQVLSQINRLDDATKCWEDGIDNNPSEIQFYKQKAKALKEQNRIDDIIKTWDTGIRNNPKSQKFYELKIEQLKEEDLLNEVIQCWDEAIKANPRVIKFYSEKANALHKQNRLEEMVQCCLEGLRIEPNSSYFSYLLTYGIKNSILLDDTLVVLDECIRHQPNEFTLYKDKSKILFLLEKIIKFKKQNRIDEVIKCWDDGIKINSSVTCFYYQKAKALVKQNRLDDAIKCLNEGIKINPSDPEFYELKARFLIDQNCKEEAINVWDEGIITNPSNALFYDYKAKALIELNLLNDKLSFWDECIRNNPSNVQFYELKAKMLIEQKRFDDAIQLWDEGINKNPNNGEFLKYKVDVIENIQFLTEGWEGFNVIKFWDEIIKKNPSNPQFYEYKAIELMRQDRLNEAIEHCNQGIIINRNYILFYVLKATTLLRLQQFCESINCLNECIKIEPSLNKIYSVKSEVLKELFLFRQAILTQRIDKECLKDYPWFICRIQQGI